MADNNINMGPVFAAVVDDLVGMIKPQVIRLAAQLQLADQVKDGPRSVADLAEATETDKNALYRLLRALASCGYFEEVEPEVFAQTPSSYVLRTDIPRSLHAFALLHGEEWQWGVWGNALQSFKTGQAIFPEVFGKDFWTYLKEDNPEAGKRFNKSMSSQSAQYDLPLAQGYNFSSAKTIVDVGGGQGSLLATILQANPTIHGLLLDQAPVIEMARPRFSTDTFKDRTTLVSGDFFEAVPSGGDIYTLKQIIHNWEDPECISILSNCRKAMNEGGRILVMDEIITPGRKEERNPALLDVLMLLLFSSQKRTEAEHRPLFEAAGLRLTRVLPTNSAYHILEAIAI